MVFSSPRFLVFLAVVLLVLRGLSTTEHKKHFLAIASCLFYAAWDWRYLGLLLFISVIDYAVALKIQGASSRKARTSWLCLSLISNFGLLAYFKYYNFFITNANELAEWFNIRLPLANIILPAGISFYVFKTLSYVIDVYRGELGVCRNWLDYTTFISFFPELIAGPIVRGSVLIPQLSRRITPSWHTILPGASMFLQGLVKKLLVADRLAMVVEPIFASPGEYSSGAVWCGLIAYSIQIYCDFSGYSDMAIGCARMIGYDLPENFNMPYLSTSITEFWRRWHITLSSWLRDYLYIPLGGNRNGTLTTYRNLMLTMLLGGLWHGASWNFVIWGGLHGLALAAHKLWCSLGKDKFTCPPVVGWFATTLLACVAWVPFRSESSAATSIILRKLCFLESEGGGRWYPESLFWCLALVVAGHLVGYWVARLAREPNGGRDPLLVSLGLRIDSNPISGPYLCVERASGVTTFCLVTILLIVLLFAPLNTNPFIYFQF